MSSLRRCSPIPRDLLCHKRKSHPSLRKSRKSALLVCHTYLRKQSKREVLRPWRHQNWRSVCCQIFPKLQRRCGIKHGKPCIVPRCHCIRSLSQRGHGQSHMKMSVTMCIVHVSKLLCRSVLVLCKFCFAVMETVMCSHYCQHVTKESLRVPKQRTMNESNTIAKKKKKKKKLDFMRLELYYLSPMYA